jgi:hypothetical protein
MSYVDTGQTFQLGPRDSMVLSYMNSCIRETITVPFNPYVVYRTERFVYGPMGDEFPKLDAFSTLNDATRWRNRAEEMRLIAEDMVSEENKSVAQRLVVSYERLAELAEQRALLENRRAADDK